MKIKIGELYEGKDCHGKLVSGNIIKILEKTFIISSGTMTYVIKKSDTKL